MSSLIARRQSNSKERAKQSNKKAKQKAKEREKQSNIISKEARLRSMKFSARAID